MAGMKKRNRKHSIIDRLPPDLRDTVEQMLLTGATYPNIVEYLGEHGVAISKSSVCRYAEGYHASVQQVMMARENFRMMVKEFEKHPDVDMTKAVETLATHNVMNLLANMPEEKWQEVGADKVLREAAAIIRAVAYKKRLDTQNQSDYEAGFEAAKEIAYSALAKERPELFAEVSEYINQKKREEGS